MFVGDFLESAPLIGLEWHSGINSGLSKVVRKFFSG